MQQEPVDKRSEQTSHQSQNPRRTRTDRQGQANQGAVTQSPQTSVQKQFLQGSDDSQLPQQMPQMHSQMYREYRDPYAYHNSMQSPSVGEFINPWQLQGMQQSMQGGPSLYHSRQFVQSPNSQMMHRQALMSEIQGSVGDSPQIHYFTHREGSNQMPMQGSSPQNQSDRHSGSEPFADMAVQHQPSRGATHLTQQLGSYLITSPRSAMTAISKGQPGHIVLTAIVGNLPHSKPTVVTQTGGSSNDFEEFAQPELDIQNEQQTEENKEIQNLKQQSNWNITTSELQYKIDKINVEEFFTSFSSDDFVLLDEKVKEKMKDINQLMDTVDAKWELAYTEWQRQIMSTDEIEAIDEIFRKQLSALREIDNALELKMKETVQKLAEEMAMIKANEIFTILSDGQQSTEYTNEQIEPTITNDVKSVYETKPICDIVKTNHSGDVLLQGQQQQVHNQAMQNQDQIQDIPETMQMWQEAIKEEQMKSILENKVCESIENEDVASDDEIEYENMPDLIDPISEEILDDEILKSKFSHWFDYTSAPSGPIKETSTDDSSKLVL
jgi:hypothetical protein